MKKILVVFTGGTIGSTEKNGIINVDEQKNYRLISLYKQSYNSDIEFNPVEIMEILSENITARHWGTICNYLFSLDFDNYDGIIITHGSDTLAFTSAIIGMLFSHTEIPIILIASNLTLGTPGSNGLENFAKAVEHISSGKSKGVFTIFDKTYLSTRIMPADSCLDKFSSYGNENIELFFQKTANKKPTPLPVKNIEFKNDILMIYGYPNINFSAFKITKNVAAVLYVPYHSGTACTENDNPEYNLTDFINRCMKQNINVYLSGIKYNDGIYASLDKILYAGAIPLFGISEVSAYAKLLIAYNQNALSVNDFLEKNIYFEQIK
jgi:L-asparaginase/Glu-tRNA(Gln) amidotransferase subunit D